MPNKSVILKLTYMKGESIMDFVTELFSLISEVFTGFFGIIETGLTSVVGLFWDNTTGLTMIGTLLLVGLGVGLVWTLISFVTRLVRRVG